MNYANAINATRTYNKSNNSMFINNAEYRPVNGYGNRYYVGDNGIVLEMGSTGLRQLRTFSRSGRINEVILSNNLSSVCARVDELVAETFIDKKLKGQIRHINGNNLDDTLANLEVVSTKTDGRSKPVYQYSLEGALIEVFASRKIAAEKLNINYGTLDNYCTGKTKKNKLGFIVTYKKKSNNNVAKPQMVEKNDCCKDEELLDKESYQFAIGSSDSFCYRKLECKEIIASVKTQALGIEMSKDKDLLVENPQSIETDYDGRITKVKCEVGGLQNLNKAVVTVDMFGKYNVVVTLPNGSEMCIKKLNCSFSNKYEFMLFAENMVRLYFLIRDEFKVKTLSVIIIAELSTINNRNNK